MKHLFPWLAKLAFGLMAMAVVSAPLQAQTGRVKLKGIWPEFVSHVQVAGGHAYVAAENGLVILDVRIPAQLRSVYVTTNYLQVLQVVGDRAYLPTHIGMGTNRVSAIDILDVSNPTNPLPVGRYATRLNVSGVQVVGDYAYLTEISSESAESNPIWGLEVLDVRDPGHPMPAGGFVINGRVHLVQVADGYAYVADGSNDLRVLDISNPDSPVTVAIYNTNAPNPGIGLQGGSEAIELVGTTLYAAGADGLHILDVSSPSNLVSVLNTFTPVASCGIHLSEKYACMSLLRPGAAGGPNPSELLVMLDVSNLAKPVAIASYALDEVNCSFQVVSNRVYVAAGSAGLLVLEIVNAPSITSISRESNTIVLQWNGQPGLILQSSSSLIDPEWTDVPGSAGESSMQLPMEGTGKFFRLVTL